MRIYFATSPSPQHLNILEKSNVKGILCSFAVLSMGGSQIQRLEESVRRMKGESEKNAGKQKKIT